MAYEKRVSAGAFGDDFRVEFSGFVESCVHGRAVAFFEQGFLAHQPYFVHDPFVTPDRVFACVVAAKKAAIYGLFSDHLHASQDRLSAAADQVYEVPQVFLATFRIHAYVKQGPGGEEFRIPTKVRSW